MSIKLILAVVAVALIAITVAYLVGHRMGRSAGDVACADAHVVDVATYAAREAKAQQLARQAQAEADQAAMDDLKLLLGKAQEAAASAAATAATAEEKSKQQNALLSELTHENTDVNKWDGHCLPAALLARLHPETSKQAYPAACRSAGNGNKDPIRTTAGAAATSH